MAVLSIRGSKTNHKRGYKDEKRVQRKAQAEARQLEYDKLSLQEKLDQHNRLFPAPEGARQRERLMSKIVASKKKEVKEQEVVKVEESVATKAEKAEKKELRASQRRQLKS